MTTERRVPEAINRSDTTSIGLSGTRLLETLPDVFIIESLDRNFNGGLQGKALARALKAFNRYPRYVDVSSKNEFDDALTAFKRSGYRYLHISCHGDASRQSLQLRDRELLPVEELVDMFGRKELAQSRLFLSACSMGADSSFPEMVFSRSRTRAIHSILAPNESIDLTESLVFWVAFYGEMYMRNERSMKAKDIALVANRAAHCCRRKFSLFSFDSKNCKIVKYELGPQVKRLEPVTWNFAHTM